jgi:hypothetical protein
VLWFLSGQALFFLYLSGLFRWLCRRGVIKDRTVDFTRLRTASHRTIIMIYRLGSILWRLAVKSGQKALPHAVAIWQTLTQWVLTLKNH